MSNTSWDIRHNISVSFDLHSSSPSSCLFYCFLSILNLSFIHWSQLLSSLCAASMTDRIYISSSRAQVQAHICVAAKICNETKPLFDFFFFHGFVARWDKDSFRYAARTTHTHFKSLKDVRFDFVPYYTDLIRGSHLSVAVTVSSPQRYLSIV